MLELEAAAYSADVGETIDPSSLSFKTAKKTKSLQAKPMRALLTDPRVITKFLLDTLEGTQMLKANSMVCLGPCNDVWQQDNATLHKSYVPTHVDEEGWTTFEPKPEAIRDACYIELNETGEFYIKALWGDRQADGSFRQTGHSGDYIVRNRDNPDDVWIVKGSVWNRTYEFTNEE
ncbi:MAG: hypothetical protein M0R80_02485 [Proteobacteria bacterium]|jgi:hypothetical protein|nr:hypothetical protein [Pseudomonadota bacterium]